MQHPSAPLPGTPPSAPTSPPANGSVRQRPSAPEPWAAKNGRPFISFDKVVKKFGDFVAVDGVSLDIWRGEFFCLLGGSGCGKTTLLRMLAGFENPTSGTITIDGVDMSRLPPYERPVNMMFQSYALFPHMTVEQNIAFGLKQDGLPKAQVESRVADMLDIVQMAKFARRKPHQLSGGQRQRVALARALAKRPKVLLLDEPLAALDKKLREKTQFELVNIQEKLGVTFVVVTHDQEEAMTMASRIAVMNTGWIVQVGTPTEIYEFPRSKFVADFIGSVNMMAGRISEDLKDFVVVQSEEWGGELLVDYIGAGVPGTQVAVAVRPEKVHLSATPPAPPTGFVDGPASSRNIAHGRIEEIAYYGDCSTYHVRLPSGLLVKATITNATRATERPFDWGDEVWLSFRPGSGTVLDS